MNKDTVVGDHQGLDCGLSHLVHNEDLLPEVQALIQKGEAWEKLKSKIDEYWSIDQGAYLRHIMDGLENS